MHTNAADSSPARQSRRKRRPTYFGRTLAFRRFRETEQRTRTLLDAGLLGLTEKGKELTDIRSHFARVRGIPGRIPKGYKPTLAGTRAGEEIEVTMDLRAAAMLRRVMDSAVGRHREIRFHFFAILAVYVWGTYETYLTMLFEELYIKRPQLLISNETLSFRDAIEHREELVPHLIDQQLDRLGRMSLVESTKYLDDRLNYRTSAAAQNELSSFYLVRNVIAHNTGILRRGQARDLPRGVSAESGELRVTKAFLSRMLTRLSRSVIAIERHVDAKFFRTKQGRASRAT